MSMTKIMSTLMKELTDGQERGSVADVNLHPLVLELTNPLRLAGASASSTDAVEHYALERVIKGIKDHGASRPMVFRGRFGGDAAAPWGTLLEVFCVRLDGTQEEAQNDPTRLVRVRNYELRNGAPDADPHAVEVLVHYEVAGTGGAPLVEDLVLEAAS